MPCKWRVCSPLCWPHGPEGPCSQMGRAAFLLCSSARPYFLRADLRRVSPEFWLQSRLLVWPAGRGGALRLVGAGNLLPVFRSVATGVACRFLALVLCGPATCVSLSSATGIGSSAGKLEPVCPAPAPHRARAPALVPSAHAVVALSVLLAVLPRGALRLSGAGSLPFAFRRPVATATGHSLAGVFRSQGAGVTQLPAKKPGTAGPVLPPHGVGAANGAQAASVLISQLAVWPWGALLPKRAGCLSLVFRGLATGVSRGSLEHVSCGVTAGVTYFPAGPPGTNGPVSIFRMARTPALAPDA